MAADHQQSLFDNDPPPWQLDDAAEQLVATVVFPTGPARPFDYAVPDRLAAGPLVGCRVAAPFGRGDRQVTGYCVAAETKRVERPLKSLQSTLDDHPLLSPAMLRLTRWMSEYYLCPWGTVLESVIPAGVRAQAGTRLTTFVHVPPEVAARLDTLKLPRAQLQALKILADSAEPLTVPQLAHQAGCTAAPIRSLRLKGLIATTTRRVRQEERRDPVVAAEADHELNADQQQALDAVLAALGDGRHETILLHGITGSGKTEVYIRAVQEVVSYGRQAIVLVPEISLTPQVQQRFRARFGRVAVLHSHQSDADRHWHWQRIARGEVSVVVGARSAIFAPTPHLGLIVIDEEHESSFKQDTSPRYHARDVAWQRAAAERVPLVLGSATPALETYHRAMTGEFRLIELPRRVLDRPLPDVLTIDLRDQQGRAAAGAISRQLKVAMDQALADGGQVILLLNRRGYSTHIQCPTCGEVVLCPNCDIALTHHREGETAICHYCDYEIPTPRRCPKCNAPGLNFRGRGTQKLEAEVRARFPGHVCLRMDTDSMQGPGSHERALAAFRSGEVQILLGTQMIAKGLDFPNVTLVGVINSDTALHLPDFRAAERTFQLIVQVAGRTGRGDRGGRVLVQTYTPDHPAIALAARHDYQGFARQELATRQAFHYPPFSMMARWVMRGPQEPVVAEFAAHVGRLLAEALAERGVEGRILGPVPALFAKHRGLYRYHIQVQSADRDGLHATLASVAQSLQAPTDVQWIVDVDAVDML